MEAGVEAGGNAPQERLLDPFSHLPGVASRIDGLGGDAPGHDPTYVFHTDYVPVARGYAHFTIRFRDLAARRGTLSVRVHMLPTEEGARARLMNSERITLGRLIHEGGEIAIRFEAYQGMTYAVYGSIADDTDARADGLTITLDRPGDGTAHGVVADARTTAFRNEALRPSARLISTDRATLAAPVSQMCTPEQFDEETYARWLTRLHMRQRRHWAQWEPIYILQVLERYGALGAGARGLGFGGADWLPAAVAANGIDVTAASPEPQASSPWPTEFDEDGAGPAATGVSTRPVDLTAIPEDLVNYDFAWSCSARARTGSIAAAARFAERSLDCLRPGGIAVHTDRFLPGPHVSGAPDLQRRDVERLALSLISRGHDVAQIKVGAGERPADEPTAFGIIVRKAHSAL